MIAIMTWCVNKAKELFKILTNGKTLTKGKSYLCIKDFDDFTVGKTYYCEQTNYLVNDSSSADTYGDYKGFWECFKEI